MTQKEIYVTEASLPEKTGNWMERVLAGRRRDIPLRPERAGLLVVDLQKFFLDPGSPAHLPSAPAVLPNVVRLVDAFRDRGLPVFFSRHAHVDPDKDGGMMTVWWRQVCRDGTSESELSPLLRARPEEIFRKCRYSAFSNADLDRALRRAQVEDLLVAGIVTNLCVESTVRDAFDMGYRTFIPVDATAAHTESYHIGSVMSLAQGFSVVGRTEDFLAALR